MNKVDFIDVDLGERSYPIIFSAVDSEIVRKRLTPQVKGRKLLLVSDDNVSGHGYPLKLLPALAAASDCFGAVLPHGEKHKTLDYIGELCEIAAHNCLDRKSLFIALGGGVTGDMTGFAAAVYMRGCDFIQVPTTLLAMVDSSVGGKTGVDLPHGKNLVGAFHQPKLVVIDTAFLDTLPKKELRSGLAEVVKTAVIKSKRLFELLERDPAALLRKDMVLYDQVIKECCSIKAKVVAADEKESGVRAILNYGHTFGHAIEKLSHFKFGHGRAVALGMSIAGHLALIKNMWCEEDLARQNNLLEKLGLPIHLPKKFKGEEIYKALFHDKKSEGGTLTFVLPAALGKVKICRNIDEESILLAIDRCRNKKFHAELTK